MTKITLSMSRSSARACVTWIARGTTWSNQLRRIGTCVRLIITVSRIRIQSPSTLQCRWPLVISPPLATSSPLKKTTKSCPLQKSKTKSLLRNLAGKKWSSCAVTLSGRRAMRIWLNRHDMSVRIQWTRLKKRLYQNLKRRSQGLQSPWLLITGITRSILVMLRSLSLTLQEVQLCRDRHLAPDSLTTLKRMEKMSLRSDIQMSGMLNLRCSRTCQMPKIWKISNHKATKRKWCPLLSWVRLQSIALNLNCLNRTGLPSMSSITVLSSVCRQLTLKRSTWINSSEILSLGTIKFSLGQSQSSQTLPIDSKANRGLKRLCHNWSLSQRKAQCRHATFSTSIRSCLRKEFQNKGKMSHRVLKRLRMDKASIS